MLKNYAVVPFHATPNKITAAAPKVDGFMLSWWWGDSNCVALQRQIQACQGKPFFVRFCLMPIPSPSPISTVMIDSQAIGVSWDLEYGNTLNICVASLLSFLQPFGDQFLGIRYAYTTPYNWDDECGLKAHGPDGDLSKQFADAGYTPTSYLSNLQACFAFAAQLPPMAEKYFTCAPYTPGDEPSVNNAGQVVPRGTNSFLIANTILDNLAAIPNSVVAFTTWDGSDLSPFWQAASQRQDIGFALQPKTGLSQSVFTKALALANDMAGVEWYEPHLDQVDWLE